MKKDARLSSLHVWLPHFPAGLIPPEPRGVKTAGGDEGNVFSLNNYLTQTSYLAHIC